MFYLLAVPLCGSLSSSIPVIWLSLYIIATHMHAHIHNSLKQWNKHMLVTHQQFNFQLR